MKRARWACFEAACRAALAGAALWLAVGDAAALVIEPATASFIVGEDELPPARNDPRWQTVGLPATHNAPVVWYRVSFERPATESNDAWMLYLPYLYGGGKVWLNGDIVASVLEASKRVRVRQGLPLLVPLPAATLRDTDNVIHIRSVATHLPSAAGVPRLGIGSQVVLQQQSDRRLFWVRSVPLITVVTGSFVGALFLFIWWKRRDEVLYGLFGLGALLWAVRTMTFIYDAMPAPLWAAWRFTFYATTGGFIVVMALFSLALAGWYRRRIAWAMAAYWLIGPLVFAFGGERGEEWVNRWWIAGFIPLGVTMFGTALVAAVRQRSVPTVVLAVALALAVLTGVHDYLVAWRASVMLALAPEWAGHRIFLLHHGANLLLIAMGAILTARFVRTLLEVETMNRTLEARVAERERQIAASYEHIAALQREQAATDERARIMQDMHDGLGSRLFTSLLQVERGALVPAAMADVLRGCIGDMRLALETLAASDQDFSTMFGNFRFRWERQLRDAGVASNWQIDDPARASSDVTPHTALQLLSVLQEALTNVLKHADAKNVRVELKRGAAAIELIVEDDGLGFVDGADADAPSKGRGLANMRARARRIGARLGVESVPGRTRLSLLLPIAGADPAAAPASAPAARLAA